jgi:DNA-binding beta-propeller fold protein YncE
MQPPMPSSALLAALVMALGVTVPAGAQTSAPLYDTTKVVPLGAPDAWDYLTYDDAASRLYIAHGSTIDIVDGKDAHRIGQVKIAGANGVAVVPALGKGYAGSRDHKSVVIFDLKTFRVLKELPADEDTDGVVYDGFSQRVFVIDGDPHNITVVDTKTDTVAAPVALHGKPEFAAVDGKGKLFVAITDKREIQRVDTRTGVADAAWPIADCDRPHGLSIDQINHRLFATCLNSKMLVIDATDGHIVASLPIGAGSDGSVFDTKRKLAFSSNGSGTLSIIHEVSPTEFEKLAELPTQPLARTVAVDSASGRIYLVAADRIEIDPKATDPRKRYSVKPGTVRLLVLDPAGSPK